LLNPSFICFSIKKFKQMNKINHTFMLLLIASISFIACESSELDEKEALVPLTVTEDLSLPSIQITDTYLHSEAFGNASDPMIVVLHGGPGVDYRGVLNFKDLAKDGYYVVFYDQRGTGLSQRHDEEHYEDKKVQFFIDDLSEVIAYYRSDETQRLILAGHSWGAMLATAYVNQNPDKVDQVILAEPGGFTWPQTEAYIQRSFAIKPFTESTNDIVYMDQFLTGSVHEILDYKLALLVSEGTTGDPTPPPFWRLGGFMFSWAQDYAIEHPEEMDFTANLSKYENSVLFAYSENNEHYGEDHARLVSAAYPNVELVKIDNSGHEMIHFGWESFYPIIKAYLN